MKLVLVLGGVAVVVGLLVVCARLKSRSADAVPLWSEGESIYGFISRHLVTSTGELSEKTGDLPDEAKRNKPGEVHWVAGGLDGVFGHHGGGAQAEEKASRVASLIAQIARTGAIEAQRELYGLLLESTVLDILDPAVERMVQQQTPVTPTLHEFAITMATRSPDREPVKFAIALLGIIRDPADMKVVVLLGKHEEFTLFSAVALTNSLSDPEPALLDLAQHVHGWGRIHTVERLAKTKTPSVKRWLLLHGYDNSVMHEYLAYTCAVAGELHVTLSADLINSESLKAATDLLRALIAGGPAQDINDYENAAAVATDYLRHVKNTPPALPHFTAVHALADYLRSASWDSSAREENGWTEERRRAVLASADEFLGRRGWEELVRQGLTSEDRTVFFEADSVAKQVGVDTWSIHWKRVQADPTDASRWFSVMAQANAERIGDIVQLAESKLPLAEIASGPADSLGLGSDFKTHSALDMVMQSLGPYSGKGKTLVLAGLRSPVVRNRNMALKALAAWNAADRDAEIVAALRRASAEEPRPEVKERIELVLDGKPVD
ncbi:MAG: hypothetical protein IPL39_12130 [Opitutaceae bacterium]|nr:hypothetical protein [Opitutaceae bacterium]